MTTGDDFRRQQRVVVSVGTLLTVSRLDEFKLQVQVELELVEGVVTRWSRDFRMFALRLLSSFGRYSSDSYLRFFPVLPWECKAVPLLLHGYVTYI